MSNPKPPTPAMEVDDILWNLINTPDFPEILLAVKKAKTQLDHTYGKEFMEMVGEDDVIKTKLGVYDTNTKQWFTSDFQHAQNTININLNQLKAQFREAITKRFGGE